MSSFDIANCIDVFKEKISTQEYLEVMNLLKNKYSNESNDIDYDHIQIYFKIEDEMHIDLMYDYFISKKNIVDVYFDNKTIDNLPVYHCFINFKLTNELISKKQCSDFINKFNKRYNVFIKSKVNYIYNIGDNKIKYTIDCKPLKKKLINNNPFPIISKIYFAIEDKEDFLKKFDNYFTSLSGVYKTSTFIFDEIIYYNINLNLEFKILEEDFINFMNTFKICKNYIVDRAFYKFENCIERIKYRYIPMID
jgi:hypothetical protein